LTSTAGDGQSFGWINRDYFRDFAAGKVNPHISPFGGEDRFWLGPEGGQFSLFFPPGKPFDFEHWRTPPFLDTEPFDLIATSESSVSFRRQVRFQNHAATPFHIQIDREVRLLSPRDTWDHIGIQEQPGVRVAACQSDNRITNLGDDFHRDTGLLSIWILSMLNSTPNTTVVIPIRDGAGASDHKRINDDYFGLVGPDRLRVIGGIVYFRARADRRAKIGTPPHVTQPVCGSYDAQTRVLTIVQFTFDPAARDYVNSAWKWQDDPYSGDVINSYTDGPPAPGTPQMGNFYELETSSAAVPLTRGQTLAHTHRTMHFVGEPAGVNAVSMATLGVSLSEIERVFG
jgi:hypothetical protein